MEQKPDQHADTSDTPLDEGAKSGPMGSSTKRDGGIIPTANPPEVEGEPFQAPGQPDRADAAGMLDLDDPTAYEASGDELDGSPDREADGETPNASPPAPPGKGGAQDEVPE